MWEYEMVNGLTGERVIIWGRTCAQAMRKAGLDPDNWACVNHEYVD